MVNILKKYLRPYLPFVVAVVIFQTFQTFCTLYLPNMNAHIIDNGVAVGDIAYIQREGSMMIVLTIAQITFSILATYFGVKTALGLGRDIRKDLFYKVQDFSVREVAKFGAPTLITRSTNDIQQVQMLVTFLLTLIISAPIMLVGGVILSLEQDVALSWVIAATLPIIVIVAAVFISMMMPIFKKFQKKVDRLNEVLREQITGVRVVRVFTREQFEKDRFFKVNHDLFDLNLKTGRIMTLLFPIFMLIVNLSILAIMWFGGHRVSNGEMEIGAITAFITYMMYIMMAVLMSSMVFMLWPRAEVSAKRIREVLKTKPSVANVENPTKIDNPKGVIEFRNVEFRYPGAADPILKDLNFTAEPGKTTAIIGSTGSGKSTILRLIPRLFDPTAGDVLFDGINLKNIALDDLNKLIGIIPQKSFLFAGTIADNLRFGNENATEEDMWEALEISQSADFIREKAAEMSSKNSLEDKSKAEDKIKNADDLSKSASKSANEKTNGNNTVAVNPLDLEVSQGGTNFSGGQRQRLAIARAIIHKPKVFQFDDSFSALDYTTDHNLREALKKVTKDAAVIIVAQRISTIRHAHQILVLNDGEIVGRGTHEELLKTCETYQEIVDSQLSAEEALK